MYIVETCGLSQRINTALKWMPLSHTKVNNKLISLGCVFTSHLEGKLSHCVKYSDTVQREIFTGPNFCENAVSSPCPRRNFHGFNFCAFSASYWPCPLIIAGLTEDERCTMGEGRTSSAGLKQRYSAIVRSSETSAQNAHVKISTSSYFRILVLGHENRENLDLAKISRYTVALVQLPTRRIGGVC